MSQHDRDRDHDRDAPPEGSSPARPPREDPPEPEDADITPTDPQPVPDPDGQGGVAWEERRKGEPPSGDESEDGEVWDDRGGNTQQDTGLSEKSWRKPQG
jgi:hypothetical protein